MCRSDFGGKGIGVVSKEPDDEEDVSIYDIVSVKLLQNSGYRGCQRGELGEMTVGRRGWRDLQHYTMRFDHEALRIKKSATCTKAVFVRIFLFWMDSGLNFQ